MPSKTDELFDLLEVEKEPERSKIEFRVDPALARMIQGHPKAEGDALRELISNALARRVLGCPRCHSELLKDSASNEWGCPLCAEMIPASQQIVVKVV